MPKKKSTKTILEEFKLKCETALAQVQSVEDFREDKMIDFVFKVGDVLFNKDLDTMDGGWLVRHGGRLTGVYAYLGNKASRARGERDVYAQKKDEVFQNLVLAHIKKSSYKVTEARAIAKLETTDLENLVIAKEVEKNNLENVMLATDKMVGFIQSALRVKNAEQYKTGSNYDNASGGIGKNNNNR